MSGKVYLVGAGPGDPGLLTVKALNVIRNAEVVLYDKLVGVQILDLIRSDAKKINVGKHPENHLVPQGEINQVILQEALKGKDVVRLKGGDPFLFGRGGEELELLALNGIEFEVIPGITSAIAVPSYAGIPVTHREATSSLHIFTGHARDGKDIEIPYKSAAESHGTLIFLMGVAAMQEICEGLIREGMQADIPAAVIEQGTTKNQKKVIATLETLAEEARKEQIKNPAVIVIGEVCKYSSQFDWYKNKPLFGKRIIVTRPKEVASVLSEKIRDLGGEALEFPCIETRPLPLISGEEAFCDMLSKHTWLVFTSAFGVQIVFEKMREQKRDARDLKGLKIAVIGPGTAQALRRHFIEPDYMPLSYDVEQLAIGLSSQLAEKDRVLLLRAEDGSKAINKIFDEEGIDYNDIPVYQTFLTRGEGSFSRPLISEYSFDVAAFTSRSTVRGFVAAFPEMDFSKMTAICIGKETAKEAEKHQMNIIISKEATIDSLVEAIREQGRRSPK